ncbi:MAG: TolC family protein [Deltaproteobacteria bacterium]|nr:TolC family protein [Deltaproteobacteria bacterium]
MIVVLLLVSTSDALPLDAAVEAALARAPISDLATARVDEAEARVRTVSAPLLPSVEATGAAVWQNEVVLDLKDQFMTLAQAVGLPVQPSMFDDVDLPVVQPGFQWQAGAQVRQALLAPAAWLARRAAHEGALLASLEGEADRYALTGAVLEAWHASARHHALLEDARGAVAVAERAASLAETLVTHGVASEDQVLPSRSAVASAHAVEGRARAAAAAADATLALLTGLDDISADPPDVPAETPSLATCLHRLERPDLAAAGARVDAADAVTSATRASALPVLGAGGGVVYLDPEPYLGDQWNWKVQVQLTMPLLQGGAVRARGDEAAARAAQARAAERALRERAQAEVIRLHGELAASLASLREHESAVDLARRAVTAAEARLNQGGGSLLALEQARGALATAELHRTLSRADAARASDLLDLATGGPPSGSDRSGG